MEDPAYQARHFARLVCPRPAAMPLGDALDHGLLGSLLALICHCSIEAARQEADSRRRSDPSGLAQ